MIRDNRILDESSINDNNGVQFGIVLDNAKMCSFDLSECSSLGRYLTEYMYTYPKKCSEKNVLIVIRSYCVESLLQMHIRLLSATCILTETQPVRL